MCAKRDCNGITPDKSVYVQRLFDKIAPVYDLLNNIISLGLHKKWKRYAIDQLEITKGDKVLDLCCGTGDMTALMFELFESQIEITAVDFSSSMLEIAEKRFNKVSNVSVIRADALNLPFDDQTFDKVIISFGLRNLKDISAGVQEIFRVLKTPGTFVNIDFGKPEGAISRYLFDTYFKYNVPLMGRLFGSKEEYQYLTDSIKTFPAPLELLKVYEQAGFAESKQKSLFAGFVSIQRSIK